MKKSIQFTFLLFVFCAVSYSQNSEVTNFDKRVKVALRAVGNSLLIAQNDSTSRVLPITKVGTNTFKLSFESVLSFNPIDLSNALNDSFTRANIKKNYLVEVEQCKDLSITYSFQMNYGEEDVIIPCSGREVPQSCYTIFVEFPESKQEATTTTSSSSSEVFFYILVGLVLLFLGVVFYSKYNWFKQNKDTQDATCLGKFKFYPEQNKLIKEAEEISLTKKETELLEILVAKPNEIVKREELTKKVWEDNGVIVGRSLDTYISKLRKKLQDDESIKITNIHGVGYKLEVV